MPQYPFRGSIARFPNKHRGVLVMVSSSSTTQTMQATTTFGFEYSTWWHSLHTARIRSSFGGIRNSIEALPQLEQKLGKSGGVVVVVAVANKGIGVVVVVLLLLLVAAQPSWRCNVYVSGDKMGRLWPTKKADAALRCKIR